MSTDAEGHPYIVTYWRDADSEVPQYRLVWNDGKGWQNRQIMNRSQGFSLKGGGTKMIPISRPRIAVDKGKAYFVFRDAERGSKVSMAYTDDVKSENTSETACICAGNTSGRRGKSQGFRGNSCVCIGNKLISK